jgi:preprotein translocase subunit SecF
MAKDPTSAVERAANRQRFVELIPEGARFDFVGARTVALAISAVLVLASAALWIVRGGPNYGIDFAGGTMLHLRFAAPRGPAEVRKLLAQAGRADTELQDLGGHGDEFLIRLPGGGTGEEDVAEETVAALRTAAGEDAFEVLRSETVGPKVGKDLRRKAIWAVMASTLLMGAYITLRFQLRFGIGAAVALAHDVAVTMGALLLLNYEFDLSIVAALLTIVGFSVNDTVIVSDRIRENMHKMRRVPLAEIANRSINETLSRTIITTGTALFVILALYLLGGNVIHGFAFALLVGFAAGTYSTVFVVTPVVLLLPEWGARSHR